MTTPLFDQTTTKNLLQYCYTCTDAHECTTEEICRECWWNQEQAIKQTDELNETRQLLAEYYA